MQLSRISEDTADVAYAIASRLYHPSRGNPCAFFIFSDIAADKTASERLANFVATSGFGIMSTSGSRENPHTGNYILIYTWAINHEQFKRWYSQQRIMRMKNVGC